MIDFGGSFEQPFRLDLVWCWLLGLTATAERRGVEDSSARQRWLELQNDLCALTAELSAARAAV